MCVTGSQRWWVHGWVAGCRGVAMILTRGMLKYIPTAIIVRDSAEIDNVSSPAIMHGQRGPGA